MAAEASAVAAMSFPDLLARKEEIMERQKKIGIVDWNKKKQAGGGTKKRNHDHHQQQHQHQQRGTPLVPFDKKSDVQWDFVMKEMMWLATDFQTERKRQLSLGKKVAAAVKQFHKTKESRRARELAEAELKRRRLAAKLNREVKGWWSKVEKVIAYKQRLESDAGRREAMDKQLVALVQQTEKYGVSLSKMNNTDDDPHCPPKEEDDEEDDSSYESRRRRSRNHQPTKNDKRRRRTQHRRHTMTIEEALATVDQQHTQRRTKNMQRDYSRIQVENGVPLYGESTASDTASDGSYVDDTTEEDDETTFLEAEARETNDRKKQQQLGSSSSSSSRLLGTDDSNAAYLADPEELLKLQEEGSMEIDDVLKRLDQEGKESQHDHPGDKSATSAVTDDNNDTSPLKQHTKVWFKEEVPANNNTPKTRSQKQLHRGRRRRGNKATADPGNDADDDADASDVEDFLVVAADDSSDGSAEFFGDEHLADDETTIDAEEKLGRDMSHTDELELLKREGEMSVEELQKLYGSLDSDSDSAADDDSATKESSHDVRSERTTAAAAAILATGVADVPTAAPGLEQLLREDGAGDDDEFLPATIEGDDETTLDVEERLGREMSHEEEMNMLQKEKEIPIDQLRAMYAAMNDTNNSHPLPTGDTNDMNADIENSMSDTSSQYPTSSAADLLAQDIVDEIDEDEFQLSDAPIVDDETTVEAEESLGRDMSYKEEIELLQRESEISVEELRKLYANIDNDGSDGSGGSDDDNSSADGAINDSNKDKYVKKRESSSVVASMFEEDDNREQDEFRPEIEDVDDETTLIAEEMLAQEISPEDELALLAREGETSIESLRKMYQNMESVNEGDDAIAESSPSSVSYSSIKRKQSQDDTECIQKKRRMEQSNNINKEDNEDEGLAALQRLQASEEKVRQTLASRPFLLSSWVKLREYQQVGLNWLVSSQTRRLNGILADEMGLGKTLQTIALLSYLAAYKGIWGPHLVIVPTSCIVNWETEFKRFSPGLKVLCYYGSAKRRKELRTGWTKSNFHHVIVTSYQLAVQDAFAFKRKKWYYMILDEAQNIKNFQSQRWQTLINFNSQRRLLLTGTPLQNNLMELWSLLHFLMPYIFRSRKEFSYWFSNPMNNIIEGNSKRSEELISRLHGIIRPFILRRLKKDVETQMPGKFEHIVNCQLSRRQMFLYEEFMARSSTRQSLKKGGNFMGMMNVLMQLRKVCNHPDLFEPRSVITPFVTDRISMKTAACALRAANSRSVLHTVSSQLLQPLWCGAGGIPSLSSSCEHDVIRASQLSRLGTLPRDIVNSVLDSDISEPLPDADTVPGLASLLNDTWKETRQTRKQAVQFQSKVNSWRCQSSVFLYNARLLDVVKMDALPTERLEAEALSGPSIISTPRYLLEMRRSQQERADDLDEVIKKFVFCVPKAGAHRPSLEVCKVDAEGVSNEKDLSSVLLRPLERLSEPFRRSHARLSSFFPDKKLIQFDAGKLQALATLMHDLKRGGHRVLIFTQMSKMLDILEAFLNLNGHTYVRLDGGTGVDRRQRLMDRFNSDTKIFCFILSTRSGGLGINLTGADTVIFYDSDWNPAMDAQAQDRAHRIGQTRDVHIYRLITEHTIEENIFIKAKQKRNLDILVMDEGNFDASQEERHRARSSARKNESDGTQDIFTKHGLKDIIGGGEKVDKKEGCNNGKKEEGNERDGTKEESEENNKQQLSKEEMEKAMASLEDEDDVVAMRGAQKEAAEELEEFDETIELKKDIESGVESDNNEGGGKHESTTKAKGAKSKRVQVTSPQPPDEEKAAKTAEEEMEKEFAAWQSKVGMDSSVIEASLTPSERYGLKFREDIDPYWSIFAINEYRRKMEATEDMDDEVDIEEIELAKAAEEQQAFEDGDLLATLPIPEVLPRQRYLYVREKARLRSNKKRRKLTGENWTSKIDGLSNLPFWYNEDTGEALWDRPKVLIELEADALAQEKLWNALPIQPLVRIMSYLVPFPERMNCACVCRHWRAAANDISFVRHVFPVEMGIAAIEDGRKLDHNHFRTIADALAVCLPGDSIELGDGHYWVKDPDLTVNFPLKIVGDEHDPSHVVIELSGSIVWNGRGGWIEGVTFRRPRIASGSNLSQQVISVLDGGRVDMLQCVLNNRGNQGTVAVVQGPKSNGKWQNVEIKGSDGNGIVVKSKGGLDLNQCIIRNNRSVGLKCIDQSNFSLKDSVVENNGGIGVSISGNSRGSVIKCRFAYNNGGVMDKETGSYCTPCNGNVSVVAAMSPPIRSTSEHKPIPVLGFRLVVSNSNNNEGGSDLGDYRPNQAARLGTRSAGRLSNSDDNARGDDGVNKMSSSVDPEKEMNQALVLPESVKSAV